MSGGDVAFNLALEMVDEIYQRLFGIVGDEPKDSLNYTEIDEVIRKVLESAARSYVTAETPLVITNECGDQLCEVIGTAEYHESDHCPQGHLADCGCATYRGFRIRWPDGREEIVGSLRSDWQDHFGVGGGPWDGQHYTLVRQKVQP
jgi:hypothetical protein